MAAGDAHVPLGLDPLIAEAKQRARRRRALALALLVAVAGGALSMYFGLRSTSGAAPAVKTSSGFAGSPFRPGGSFTSPNGFMGDSDAVARRTTLGCVNGRRYYDGFGLWNRSRRPVTVLDVRGLSPAPGIIEWAAAQLRLSPYRRGVDEVISRDWSSRPTAPVTIPPGHEATVESNFIFRRCGQLARRGSVAVPGSLAIRYRASGVVRQKVFRAAASAFLLVAGPRRQTCAAVSRLNDLIVSNISCAVARPAALACLPRFHEDWAECTTGTHHWLCDGSGGRHFMICDEDKKGAHGDETLPHGFKVRLAARR